MKKTLLTFFCGFAAIANSQYYTQYFDGADTLVSQSIFVNLDTTTSGIWQIGPPQKIIFESASTVPNVLITDTVNTYPDSLNSSAWFMLPENLLQAGAIAIQWNQKLDLDTNMDGGLIEFSSDSGLTWENAFYNANVYNFYGWDISNEGALPAGDPCFTGTDSTWKNIWLCFLYDYLQTITNLSIRYRIVSDSVETNQEGWMIDNLMVQETWFHPVAEQSMPSNFKVYPTVTDKFVTVQLTNTNPDFAVRQISILNMNGQFIRSVNTPSGQEQIDLSDLAPGRYLIMIESSGTKELHEIVIAR